MRAPILCASLFLACGPGPDAAAPTPYRAAPAAPAPAAVDAPQAAATETADAATPIAERYRDEARRILEAALADDRGWTRLAYLTDRIGHRFSGSKSLERAIAWAAAELERDGHENVRTEKVMVPHWVRGAESAALIAPARHELSILGLGGSVGTPRGGLRAEVVAVRTFEELDRLGEAARGKIVLFDHPMPPYSEEHGSGYDDAYVFRSHGPSRAAAHGAVGVLVRSLTARSLRTPHTGGLRYADDAPKIPAAAIAIEDADLIGRLLAGDEPVRVELRLGARTLPDAESANVIAELRGRERPEEIVVLAAHIDSWDVGQGAHDDAGGCVVMMQALTLLRELGLRPRRTVRVVLYTNEENGLRGALQYAADHADELEQHVAALESDTGIFTPKGISVENSPRALEQVRAIMPLLAPIGADRAQKGFAGIDIIPLMEAGVPGLGLWVDESRYFDYHHTAADTLDKVDPEDLRKNIALTAVVAYVVADMEERLARADE